MASVNRPTNVEQKDADVNRKLQLYGIISAFQNGKVPSVGLILPSMLFCTGTPFRITALECGFRCPGFAQLLTPPPLNRTTKSILH
jgi:hypothetical protein